MQYRLICSTKAHAVLWRLFESLVCDLFDCLFLLLMAQIRKLLGLPQMSLYGLLRFLILLLRAESAESVGHQSTIAPSPIRYSAVDLRKSFRPMVLADLWPHICSFNPHAPAAHHRAPARSSAHAATYSNSGLACYPHTGRLWTATARVSARLCIVHAAGRDDAEVCVVAACC